MDVEVHTVNPSGDGIAVRATVFGPKGELKIRHTYPKDNGYLEEDDQGVPAFVKHLKSLYDKKMKKIEDEGVQGKTSNEYEGSYSI